MSASSPAADPLLKSALACLEARDRDGLADALRRMLARDPNPGRQWLKIQKLADIAGETSLSIDMADRAARADEATMADKLAYAGTLARLGRTDEALRWLDEDRAVSGPQADHLRGTLFAETGQLAKAETCLRSVLKAVPLSGPTWLTLAGIRKSGAADADIGAMRNALRQPQPPANKAALHYAIGTALDDAGETDAAFAAFSAGATIRQQLAPWNAAEAQAQVAALCASWTPAARERLTAAEDEGTAPVFVLGLPRSGTTLTEQVLTMHPALDGAGETGLLTPVLMGLRGLAADTTLAWQARQADPAAAWAALGTCFDRLVRDRMPTGLRVIDKTPAHSRMVPQILAAMPGARIIHVRRQPAATALSCFRTHFSEGLGWSWRLEDIAAHFRAEEQLWAHWDALLPGRILSVAYEDLTSDTVATIAAMCAFLGLDPVDAMQRPDQSERAVSTASVTQVREPIHDRRISGWQRYEAHLAPFLKAYSAA